MATRFVLVALALALVITFTGCMAAVQSNGNGINGVSALPRVATVPDNFSQVWHGTWWNVSGGNSATLRVHIVEGVLTGTYQAMTATGDRDARALKNARVRGNVLEFQVEAKDGIRARGGTMWVTLKGWPGHLSGDYWFAQGVTGTGQIDLTPAKE